MLPLINKPVSKRKKNLNFSKINIALYNANQLGAHKIIIDLKSVVMVSKVKLTIINVPRALNIFIL